MLVLSQADILKAVALPQLMDEIEAAIRLYETPDYQMPDRMHIDLDGNTLLVMPCSIPDAFGTKLVTVFPDNAGSDIPVINGVVILNARETGQPLALLNGLVLTALRTGAVGGVSLRYLTPEDTHTLGLVGAGVQGLYQVRFAAVARRLTDIFIFDSASAKVPAFLDRLAAFLPGISLHCCRSPEELLENSQVVITATTSQAPVLPEVTRLLAGRHFVGIGSFKPLMREFPAALYPLLSLVFVDTWHALRETGDLAIPLASGWLQPAQVTTIGRAQLDHVDWSALHQSTTLFKSVGMALFDIFAARLIYRQALKQGLGVEISL